MFHRRLLLLALGMGMLMSLLGMRLAYLSVGGGPDLYEEAQKSLRRRVLIKTERGRIVDRKGRVLAEDAPSSDVAVAYDVITGRRFYRLARSHVYRDYRADWERWSDPEREQRIREYLPMYRSIENRLWAAIRKWGRLTPDELDRRKSVIIHRVHLIRAERLDRAAKRRAEELGEDVELADVASPIAEETETHTILRAVSTDVKHEFRNLVDELTEELTRLRGGRAASPGIAVVKSKTRRYPYRLGFADERAALGQTAVKVDRSTLPKSIGSAQPLLVWVDPTVHLVGGMRERIWAEDVDLSKGGKPFWLPGGEINRKGYLPGDHIGLGGVEQAEEDRLRGARGLKYISRKDRSSLGRQDPVSGRDVQLTIDIELQKRMQAFLDPAVGLLRKPDGTPLNGTVVVVDVDSSEVLAAASVPTPEQVQRTARENPGHLKYLTHPQINRAWAAQYPPGSTVKPLIYCMAVAARRMAPHHRFDCQGYLTPGKPRQNRCWIYKMYGGVHGPMDAEEAMARSCNVFSFRVAQVLGIHGMVAHLRMWGFDRKASLGPARESRGSLPRKEKELVPWNAIHIGIGQGRFSATPVQVANAHAALARGGEYLDPLLIANRRNERDERSARSLEVPPPAVDQALQGMAGTLKYGTGKKIDLIKMPGLRLRAKTGTAQAPNLKDEDGRIIRKGDHAWFVCHVVPPGRDRAAYIVVSVVEYGGSGGRAAGPVANQAIHALKAEGYLDPPGAKKNEPKDGETAAGREGTAAR